MVRIIQQGNKELYQCEECGLKYESKKIAETCQAWCQGHTSCNLDIMKYAIEEKGDDGR